MSMHTLEASWIQEQNEFAAQVVILPDDLFTPLQLSRQMIAASTSSRFQVVSLPQHHQCEMDESEIKAATVDTSSCIYYGGVDVSFPENDADQAAAVYVVLESKTLTAVYTATEFFQLTVPYIPGFLAFREIDPLVRLVRQQQSSHPAYTPSAILVDGNGVLHPRRAGIACGLGVRTGIPTIGVGKTLYCHGGWTNNGVAHLVAMSLVAAVQHATTKTVDTPSSTLNDTDLWVDCHVVTPDEQVAVSENDTDETLNQTDRESLVRELSRQCYGLAIPLVECVTQRMLSSPVSESSEYHSDRDASPVSDMSAHPSDRDAGPWCRLLACVLIGHGGRMRVNKPRSMGTQKPIYISIGHHISWRDAVAICTSICLTRIPEPIRQADLIGRELLRQRVTPC